MSLAVQFSEYGTSEVLQVVDVVPPDAGPGQVRLSVRAAGINPVDWKILQGFMQDQFPVQFPAGLGNDVAGVVDQVGAGVTAFKVGDEVLGLSLSPSYAQYAIADPASLLAKPAALPWDVAGSLAGAGGTAWIALDRLGLVEGETLLIHAASGGVGTFAAQLAVSRGVRVIGTASAANQDYLRSLGVTPVLYGEGLGERVRSLSPNGIDAVLDASGHGEIPVSIELAGGPERVLSRGLRPGRHRYPAARHRRREPHTSAARHPHPPRRRTPAGTHLGHLSPFCGGQGARREPQRPHPRQERPATEQPPDSASTYPPPKP
jgi:NADPH:quinone reductase-like Zn-dependent oxidoreductase